MIKMIFGLAGGAAFKVDAIALATTIANAKQSIFLKRYEEGLVTGF
jgi:hypothetical protein